MDVHTTVDGALLIQHAGAVLELTTAAAEQLLAALAAHLVTQDAYAAGFQAGYEHGAALAGPAYIIGYDEAVARHMERITAPAPMDDIQRPYRPKPPRESAFDHARAQKHRRQCQKIWGLLSRNPHLSLAQLGELLDLSSGTVWFRMQTLIHEGVIGPRPTQRAPWVVIKPYEPIP